MRAGLVTLIVAYGFSQFFRAFLAVLTPVLERDLGAAPDDLALASGLWFLTFAVMQIPVGELLDRIGPRLTAAVIFAIGTGGGSVAFALAQTPGNVAAAMALIGIGCAPILMAGYYILAREYPVRVFATLAGAMIGFGGLGNILGSAPLAWAVDTFGWRETLWGLAVLALVVAAAILVFVRDPARAADAPRGSVIDVLRIKGVRPVLVIMFVAYAPAAALRGLWAGPWLRDMFGADATVIGQVTLAMSVAMITGSFCYGPLDRVFHTRKWVIFVGNCVLMTALVALALFGGSGIVLATVLIAVIGLSGQTFAMIVAHGRAFLPPHLTGRGVTLINLMGIGAAGLMQVGTGPLWRAADARMESAAGPYQVLFLFFAAMVAVGLAIYARAEDRTD